MKDHKDCEKCSVKGSAICKLCSWGKGMEEKYSSNKSEKATKSRNKTPDYIATIIVHIILIWALYKLPDWLKFLSSSYQAVLPVFLYSYLAQIIGNLILIFSDPKWLKSLISLANNLISIVALATVYVIFPFDFGSYSYDWASTSKTVIIVAIVLTAIGALVEFINFISSISRRVDNKNQI